MPKLFAPEQYWNLTPEVKAQLTNGCGAGCILKLLVILVLIPQLLWAAPTYKELNSWANKSLTGGKDKVAHIVVGSAISYGVLYYTDNQRIAAAVPFAIGLLKESTDKNFDMYDLTSWAVGGLIGAYVAPWVVIMVTPDRTFLGVSFKL